MPLSVVTFQNMVSRFILPSARKVPMSHLRCRAIDRHAEQYAVDSALSLHKSWIVLKDHYSQKCVLNGDILNSGGNGMDESRILQHGNEFNKRGIVIIGAYEPIY